MHLHQLRHYACYQRLIQKGYGEVLGGLAIYIRRKGGVFYSNVLLFSWYRFVVYLEYYDQCCNGGIQLEQFFHRNLDYEQ